jgi:hypothetical protein
VAELGLTRAAVDVSAVAPLSAVPEGGVLRLMGDLPAGATSRVVVFLGGPTVVSMGIAELPELRAAAERYWRAVLGAGAWIETPDAFLNDVIRSSRVRCLIATRNDADGERLAPWLAAMAYGPWESEAHSIIRGMDHLGHHDFARRALDYFIHHYHRDGFLTTGYTTFGTAWHLWTLGEHYRLTGGREWLRQHAPELRRVGDWVLQQLAKTQRRGADGQPVPEYGLMPPAVMADWNAYAYHFMLNGYYFAGLRELAEALASLGDPRSTDYARGADELRANILRAYRWTQDQSPALPLRDGTWIPLYPSQVHSPGQLEDFFPGDDAGRSWAYDTELGAHQLVPAGVMRAEDPEVTRMLDHLEDVQFLGEGWFDYPAAENAQDWFNLGGFGKVQPYYGRNVEIYALRDEVRPFLRSYFNSLASLLNTEVLTLWEHFRHSGAWDKTHEIGHFLHQTRILLVQERGPELWLAPFMPSEWMQDGRSLEIRDAPTTFGPVSYQIWSRAGAREFTAEICPPRRILPDRVVWRVRHPEGRVIRDVQVDGRPYAEVDLARGIIRLKPQTAPLNVVVRFN